MLTCARTRSSSGTCSWRGHASLAILACSNPLTRLMLVLHELLTWQLHGCTLHSVVAVLRARAVPQWWLCSTACSSSCQQRRPGAVGCHVHSGRHTPTATVLTPAACHCMHFMLQHPTITGCLHTCIQKCIEVCTKAVAH